MKRLISIVASILVVGGLVMFFSLNGDKQLSKEEQRNREYEVSLVKALKNSYRDIKEIRLSEPYYSEKPRSWSCTVHIIFEDDKSITYGINHNLTYDKNFDGIMYSDKDEEIDALWKFLNSRRGQTQADNKVRIIFSNGESGVE
ncbi:hypothetical protein [Streptococcus suis]|uniref:hypothetical protein n=1 Tax=Streptococcus suis TaxID=1307 RepID=UPI000CF553C1|nr:hypothetical protein [Streptococcus suis]